MPIQGELSEGREGAMRETVLRAEGLCRQFGRMRVVEDLSLEAKRGEIVGLLGPNGSENPPCG